MAVLSRFPWRAARPRPTPPPFFGGREVPKKENRLRRRWRFVSGGNVCVCVGVVVVAS